MSTTFGYVYWNLTACLVLTPYFPRAKVRKVKNLLSSDNSEDEEEEETHTYAIQEPEVILPHWHKNVTLALISDPNVLPYSTLPPPIREHVHLIPGKRDNTGAKGYYKPIIFPNEFCI
ncbi:hypothetical protein MPER_13349 [Moniliophthora perniciosa FA553]|nr:hypothetical protein MPER_13349 [Moniliophthora perniciosa FA553]